MGIVHTTTTKYHIFHKGKVWTHLDSPDCFFHKQDGSVCDVFYWRQNSLICGPCISQYQQIDCEDTRRWWWWCTLRWWQGWEKGVSAQIHEPRRQLHADPPLIRGSPQAHASAENSTILLTSQRNVTTNMKSDIGRKKNNNFWTLSNVDASSRVLFDL